MSAAISDLPPGTSPVARRVAKAIVRPLERFLRVEAASGIVLLLATAAALVWANSPWRGAYAGLWDTKLSLGIGAWQVEPTLRFLVNDLLMAIFFFVVGLEIRREMHRGELSEPRRAILPIVAALGGMIVPAAIYALASPGGDASRGWGVPMATDIAFAVGVLALLGSRVPAALRVLLLSLAIIDDIGAIIVIAIFYSSGIQLGGLGIALGGIAAIWLLQRLGVRPIAAYVVPAIAVWAGVLSAGIHPTIAGVIIGLLTPPRAWYGAAGLLDAAHHHLDTIAQRTEEAEDGAPPAHELLEPMAELSRAHREAVSPLDRLEAALHPWVAFGILPVFALANAGVDLGGVSLQSAPWVAFGITAGLIVGKLVGVSLASYLAIKLGLASLPRGLTWRGIVVVASVAGIGFTMALFIAELAFAGRSDLLGVAKISVLLASTLAAALALILGRLLLPREGVAGAAVSVDDAEASTAS
jgi:NhaA family Na+:H+ antiporter